MCGHIQRSGFGLIEVIAALVVLSTVGVSLINLSSRITVGESRIDSHDAVQRHAWNVLVSEWSQATARSGSSNRAQLESLVQDPRYQIRWTETETAAQMLVKKSVSVSSASRPQQPVTLAIFVVP